MLFRSHPVHEEELSACVDGELAGPRRNEITVHLETCAECRATLEGLRTLRSTLAALPQAERRRSFVVRDADVERAGAKPRGRTGLTRAMPLLGGVTVMAVLTFVVLVGIDVGNSRSSGSPTESAAMLDSSTDVSAGDTAVTPAGESLSRAESSPLPQPEAGRTEAPAAAQVPADVAEAESAPDTEAVDPFDKTAEAGGLFENSDSHVLCCPTDDGADRDVAAGESEGQGDMSLRAAEGAVAAVALAAGASFAFVWWRRRAP